MNKKTFFVFIGLVIGIFFFFVAILLVFWLFSSQDSEGNFPPKLTEFVDYDPLETILICLADGVEEIEFTVPMDVLRRMGGVESVVVAKVGGSPDELMATGANGGKIVADLHLSTLTSVEYKAIVVPGGMLGSTICGEDEKLVEMLRIQLDSPRLTAAICAAPVLVLANNDLLEGKREVTCYPSMSDQLPSFIDDEAKEKPVCVDGNLVTSQGPGTAYSFAFTIAEQLYGEENVDELISGMVVNKWW